MQSSADNWESIISIKCGLGKLIQEKVIKKRSCLELSGNEMVVLVLQKGFIPLHFKRPKTVLVELWVNLFYGLNITLGISKIVQCVFAPSSGAQKWSEITIFCRFYIKQCHSFFYLISS